MVIHLSIILELFLITLFLDMWTQLPQHKRKRVQIQRDKVDSYFQFKTIKPFCIISLFVIPRNHLQINNLDSEKGHVKKTTQLSFPEATQTVH